VLCEDVDVEPKTGAIGRLEDDALGGGIVWVERAGLRSAVVACRRKAVGGFDLVGVLVRLGLGIELATVVVGDAGRPPLVFRASQGSVKAKVVNEVIPTVLGVPKTFSSILSSSRIPVSCVEGEAQHAVVVASFVAIWVDPGVMFDARRVPPAVLSRPFSSELAVVVEPGGPGCSRSIGPLG